MKAMKSPIACFLLCFLAFGALTPTASAQINSWEIALLTHQWRSENESTGWHYSAGIYGAAMRGRFSLIDYIIKGSEHRFRAGELWGASFGTGFAKERINPDGEIGEPGTRKMGTMWITIDLQAGLQAGFSVTDDLFVGLRGYKEFMFPYVVGSDYPVQSRFYNFIGANARFKRFYADLDLGFNWVADRIDEPADRTFRMQFKYLLNDKGKNLGLRLDFARKIYNGETNWRYPAVELSFGRVF